MKRRITSLFLSVCVIALNVLPAFATEYVDMQKEASERYIMDTFGYYYELYDGDGEKATEALLASKDSLQLVSLGETPNALSIASSNSFGTHTSDLTILDSSLVFDSDWDTYVYNGTWGWTQVDSMSKVNPDAQSLAPEDIIGVYSQNENRMRPVHVVMYGYNSNGTNTAFFDTQQPENCRVFGLVINEAEAKAFSFDETIVYRGRISVSLDVDYSAGDENDLIMLQYSHSWSTEETNGVGVDLGVGSAGISVSWDNTVGAWVGKACSIGLALP